MTFRIGFACKWIDSESQMQGLRPNDDAKRYNAKSTSATWLRNHPKEADNRLLNLIEHNIESVYQLIKRVSTLDARLKMVRIGIVLPMYTHEICRDFYADQDVRNYIEDSLSRVGRLSVRKDVRLSLHPGQFCVLASDCNDVVQRSIEEFEYHAYLARCMGYGQKFQDLKINVHIGGRCGADGIKRVYKKLSREARNCLTIENDEMTHGLDECLSLSKIVPIVLGIHHHWIKTGNYIDPKSDQVHRVIESWRGIRPVAHYSISRGDVLVGHKTSIKPNRTLLLNQGFNRSTLRAHSNFYWNKAVNKWAASFLEDFDLMCESKAKNLASLKFYTQL